MADVDHPKTHVEDDNDVTLPRTQPESPKHEGIDPLTESDTMYPAHDTKAESEKLGRKEEKEAAENVGTPSADEQANADTTADQEERTAKANTPDANLPDEDKTAPANKPADDTASKEETKPAKDGAGDDLPQTAKPANTNPEGERGKEVSSDASSSTTK